MWYLRVSKLGFGRVRSEWRDLDVREVKLEKEAEELKKERFHYFCSCVCDRGGEDSESRKLGGRICKSERAVEFRGKKETSRVSFGIFYCFFALSWFCTGAQLTALLVVKDYVEILHYSQSVMVSEKDYGISRVSSAVQDLL